MREEDISARNLWHIPLFRDVVYLALVSFSVWAVLSYWRIFFPLAVSLLLAYVFNDWINAIEKKYVLTRKKISFFIVITFSVLILAFFVWLGPVVTSQSQKLIAELPIYIDVLSKKSGIDMLEFIPGKLENMKTETLLSNVGEALQSTGKLWVVLRDAFTNATYFLFYLILIPIYWYYLMVNFERMLAFLIQYIPVSKRDTTIRVARKMDRTSSDFFRGRILIAFIMGGMFSIGWWLAGVPYWFLLGMLTGVLNIIPYVSALGWPVAIVFKYFEATQLNQSTDFMSIIFWPSFVYGIVQFVEGWIMTPWIQGDQTEMSVPTVLFVVFLGGYIGGIFGLLLAIPIAACIKIYIYDIILPRLKLWAEEN